MSCCNRWWITHAGGISPGDYRIVKRVGKRLGENSPGDYRIGKRVGKHVGKRVGKLVGELVSKCNGQNVSMQIALVNAYEIYNFM